MKSLSWSSSYTPVSPIVLPFIDAGIPSVIVNILCKIDEYKVQSNVMVQKKIDRGSSQLTGNVFIALRHQLNGLAKPKKRSAAFSASYNPTLIYILLSKYERISTVQLYKVTAVVGQLRFHK